jgi:hypothetical protein
VVDVGKRSWIVLVVTFAILGGISFAAPPVSSGGITWTTTTLGRMSVTSHMSVTAQNVAVSRQVATGKEGTITTDQAYVKVDIVVAAINQAADWSVQVRTGNRWRYHWSDPLDLRGNPTQTAAGFETYATVIFELPTDSVSQAALAVTTKRGGGVTPTQGIVIELGLTSDDVVGLNGAPALTTEPALTVATR